MTLSVKYILNWIGRSLAFLGVFFVASHLIHYADEMNLANYGMFQWGSFAVLIITYSATNILLVFAWWYLLAHHGKSIPRRTAITIYGQTQIAKYIPGNIFHLAGRQSMGMAARIPGLILLKATTWELCLLAVAGFIFLALVIPSFYIAATIYHSAVVFLFLSCILAFTIFLLGPKVLMAFVHYWVFLFISGVLFFSIIAIFNLGDGSLLLIIGSYVTAWLVGLVMPGAPAGVGVREFVLLLLLKGIISETDLIVAILLGRIMTVCGDVLFFVFSLLIRTAKTSSCNS